MKLEYKENNIVLRVLNETSARSVLDFYEKNRDYFDKYEMDKPAGFYTIEFIKNLMHAEYNSFVQGKTVRFFMYDTAFPNKIIGTVSFSDIKKNAMSSCVIGYKIDHDFQRMGYAQRMLTMALKIMVNECHMHRIVAYIAPYNTPSANLVKKLGFISEGTAYEYVLKQGCWEDHLRFVYIS